MMKTQGYVFSRNFHSNRVPQHIQNLVIRDFCLTNNLQYMLSATEYAMKDSYLILESSLKKLHLMDGMVFYSMFQLPNDKKYRFEIYKKFIKKNKIIFFAVENLSLKNLEGINRIENILDVQTLLPNCLSKSYLKKYLSLKKP